MTGVATSSEIVLLTLSRFKKFASDCDGFRRGQLLAQIAVRKGRLLRSYKAFAARERITAHEFAAIPNLLPWRRKQS
jgi:hypothetical protein